MPTWFTSDPHYGHASIISFSNRPFRDVEEMEEALVENYAARVKPSDTVIWVGDTFFSKVEAATETLRRLPGTKILVRGNHDRSAAAMSRIGFDVVTDSLTMHIAGHTVRVHHYPYARGAFPGEQAALKSHGLPWPEPRSGEALIHGHTHSPARRNGRMIHVGVDAWDYRPASLEEVGALIEEAFHGTKSANE